jgi:3',5'-cyclic AMP phosphodiesterase CpdA
VFTLAHLSDSHATPVRLAPLSLLLNKRISGWLKWLLERRKIHRPEVLARLVNDLQETRPNHIVITGDLTNIGLEEEFVTAGAWLRQLGDKQYVSLVPGNHDAYVSMPWQTAWHNWKEYFEADDVNEVNLASTAFFQEVTDAYFPSVRIRGAVALIGVCTAHPVPVFRAGGTVGERQLIRLERVLHELANSDLCRVVLIHHPPTHADLTLHRGLRDSAALCAVLGRGGAELVLHGHAHKTMIDKIIGSDGSIPIIGVRSASDIGSRPDRVAQYHLYHIEREDDPSSSRRFRITMRTREYNPKRNNFQLVGAREL